MTLVLKASVVAVAVAAVSSAAMAGTFTLSGAFANSTTYTVPLNGGSFLGRYHLASAAVSNFDLVARDVMAAVRFEPMNTKGTGQLPDGSAYGFYQLQILGEDSATESTTALELLFAAPSQGAGQVIVGNKSYATLGGFAATTASLERGSHSMAAAVPVGWGLMVQGQGRARAGPG